MARHNIAVSTPFSVINHSRARLTCTFFARPFHSIVVSRRANLISERRILNKLCVSACRDSAMPASTAGHVPVCVRLPVGRGRGEEQRGGGECARCGPTPLEGVFRCYSVAHITLTGRGRVAAGLGGRSLHKHSFAPPPTSTLSSQHAWPSDSRPDPTPDSDSLDSESDISTDSG